MKKLICITIFLLSYTAHANLMVRTSPVLLVVGGINGELDYAVTDSISVGLGGVNWKASLLDVDFTVKETHARVDYWLSGVFKEGWYFNGAYSSMSMDLSTKDSAGIEFTGDVSGTALLAGIGYHWQWESFHTEFGVQAGKYSFESNLELEASDGTKSSEDIPAGTSAGIEFNMGWVF